jgi:hypothetical protein
MYQTVQCKLIEFVMQLCPPEINQGNRLVIKYKPIGRKLKMIRQMIDTVSAQ